MDLAVGVRTSLHILNIRAPKGKERGLDRDYDLIIE